MPPRRSTFPKSAEWHDKWQRARTECCPSLQNTAQLFVCHDGRCLAAPLGVRLAERLLSQVQRPEISWRDSCWSDDTQSNAWKGEKLHLHWTSLLWEISEWRRHLSEGILWKRKEDQATVTVWTMVEVRKHKIHIAGLESAHSDSETSSVQLWGTQMGKPSSFFF